MAARLAILLFSCAAAPAQPETGRGPAVSLSINDFVKRALERGLSGRQIELERESAKIDKEVVMRRTAGPVVTANLTGGETGSRTNRVLTRTESGEAGLSVVQPFVTGTQINLTGAYDTDRIRSPTTSQHTLLRPGWSAGLTQPVFLFVKNPVKRTRRRATLADEDSRDAYRAGALAVRSEARGLYYDLLLKRESLAVEDRKLASSRRLMEITLDLVSAGKLAPVEATRSRVRFERDRRQHQAAANELLKSEQRAKNYIYLPLDAFVVFTSSLAYEPFDEALEPMIRFALSRNPEIERLARARESAGLDLDQAREPARPTLNLTGGYESKNSFTTLNASPTASFVREWTVGGTLAWQLYDFSVTRELVRQARLRAELAEQAHDRSVRSTRLEVTNAFMDVETAERQILDFESVRESARANIEALRIQFQNGRGRIIDVFDAENESRTIDLEYLNLLVSFYTTQDRLAQLLGAELDEL